MPQNKTPVSMETLSERICKRLADIAHEMAVDKRPIWENYRKELASLDAKSFRVIFDLRKDKTNALGLIEAAVNENTHPFVQATQGKFSFGDDFISMFMDPVLSLFTFDPEHCKGSRERYIALMVVQRFESELEDSATIGRLAPAGITIPKYFGVIESMHFDNLAYFVNGALKEHALPESKFPGQVYEADEPPARPKMIPCPGK